MMRLVSFALGFACGIAISVGIEAATAKRVIESDNPMYCIVLVDEKWWPDPNCDGIPADVPDMNGGE